MMRIKKYFPREVWGYWIAIMFVLGLAAYSISIPSSPEMIEAMSTPRFDVIIMVGLLVIIAIISKKHEELYGSGGSETQ